MQTDCSYDYVKQFDSITTNDSLREAKVLLFHLPDQFQNILALSIKCSELQLLLRSGQPVFHQAINHSPEQLVNALLPYASSHEKKILNELLDNINQYVQLKDTLEFMQAMQEFASDSKGDANGTNANPFSGVSPEDLMSLFSQ